MVTITEDIIQEIAARIAKEASPRRIVLFGSCARGEIGRDSDVDLLVVEDELFGPQRSRFEEINRLRRTLRGLAVPVDLLVFSHDEVERWKDTTNHIIRFALREGKTLYERP
jgi:predicted nucleotidyltransferase